MNYINKGGLKLQTISCDAAAATTTSQSQSLQQPHYQAVVLSETVDLCGIDEKLEYFDEKL